MVERAPEESGPAFATHTDAELMVAIAAGQGDALVEVLWRYRDALHSVASRLCGSSRADDVVQDVIVGLWRTPLAYDLDRGSLRSYLMTRARSRALDVLRNDGARRAREVAVAADGTDPYDVESEILGRLEVATLWELLATLPAVERQAISLAFFGGYSYRRVAGLLDRPEGTVKSNIRSGLRRMRSALAERATPGGAWQRST